jgi:hypothetical protein
MKTWAMALTVAAACMEYFGVDTREWARVTIKKDDLHIQGIAEAPPEKAGGGPRR